MTRMGIVTRTLTALAITCAVPAAAAAQGANAVEQGAQGSMTVEQVRDGFAIAPDVRVTRLRRILEDAGRRVWWLGLRRHPARRRGWLSG